MDLLPKATGSCLNTANWTQYPVIKCSLSLLSHSGTLRAPFGACRRLRSDDGQIGTIAFPPLKPVTRLAEAVWN